jgi:hypothetical protein
MLWMRLRRFKGGSCRKSFSSCGADGSAAGQTRPAGIRAGAAAAGDVFVGGSDRRSPASTAFSRHRVRCREASVAVMWSSGLYACAFIVMIGVVTWLFMETRAPKRLASCSPTRRSSSVRRPQPAYCPSCKSNRRRPGTPRRARFLPAPRLEPAGSCACLYTTL